MALKPSPRLTLTPAQASTGARGRDQPGKPRVLVRVWVGLGTGVRVDQCRGVRVDSGASWYWGGLTRKPLALGRASQARDRITNLWLVWVEERQSESSMLAVSTVLSSSLGLTHYNFTRPNVVTSNVPVTVTVLPLSDCLSNTTSAGP